MKNCKYCDVILELNVNWFKSCEKKKYYICKSCNRIRHRKFVDGNRDAINFYRRDYYNENKEHINNLRRIDRASNLEKYRKQDMMYHHRKMQSVIYRIRKTITAKMHHMLTNNSYETKLASLSYTLQDLKNHLESNFEPWMNWNNWGKYNPKTWNDNDPSTWTWQIDHIVPVSTFTYKSIDDEQFKSCWGLANLRPYSAKQNIIDGSGKVRHGKKLI